MIKTTYGITVCVILDHHPKIMAYQSVKPLKQKDLCNMRSSGASYLIQITTLMNTSQPPHRRRPATPRSGPAAPGAETAAAGGAARPSGIRNPGRIHHVPAPRRLAAAPRRFGGRDRAASAAVRGSP